jgi:hypothetical protein
MALLRGRAGAQGLPGDKGIGDGVPDALESDTVTQSGGLSPVCGEGRESGILDSVSF